MTKSKVQQAGVRTGGASSEALKLLEFYTSKELPFPPAHFRYRQSVLANSLMLDIFFNDIVKIYFNHYDAFEMIHFLVDLYRTCEFFTTFINAQLMKSSYIMNFMAYVFVYILGDTINC